MNYEQVLRSIGQGLEALDVEVFDLEVAGESCIVRGNSTNRKKVEAIDARAIKKAFLHVCKTAKGRFLRRTPTQELSPCSELTLHFSQSDIERLEREGLELRSKTHSVPNPHSLPQALRTLGRYVDQKEGRLFKICVRSHGVSVTYGEPFGSEKIEHFSPTNVYDMWVRMYKMRKRKGFSSGE